MTETIKTTLIVPRKLWRKIKILAGDKGVSANDLVIETLEEKFGCIEVTV
jgi:predicted HicB family RNase H-like nuclease